MTLDKVSYDWGRKLVYLLAGKAKFGTGEAIPANLLAAKATEVHLTGALGQGVFNANC